MRAPDLEGMRAPRRSGKLDHARRWRSVGHAVTTTMLLVMGVFGAVLLGVASTAPAHAAAAATGGAAFLHRDYDLRIQRNGDVAVAERWQVHFAGGPYTSATLGIFLAHTRGVDFDHITGADTNSERVADVADSKTGNRIRQITWSFPAVTDATRTFTIPYTLHGALGLNATQAWLDRHLFDGPGRGTFPVAATHVTLGLPAAASASDMPVTTAYPGAQLASSRVDERTAAVDGQNLNSGQPLEVMVVFPRGQLDASVPKPAWQQSDTPPTLPTPIEFAAAPSPAPAPEADGGFGGLLGNVGLVLGVGVVIVAILGFLVWRLTRRVSGSIAELQAMAPDGNGDQLEEPQAYATKPLPAIDLNFGEVEWPRRHEQLDLSALGLEPLETTDLSELAGLADTGAAQGTAAHDASNDGHSSLNGHAHSSDEQRGAGAASGVGEGDS